MELQAATGSGRPKPKAPPGLPVPRPPTGPPSPRPPTSGSPCPALPHGPPSPRPPTSGSPVSWLVWMRMVPMRTSLHTARSAGSMVSPARRMDTPVIWGDEAELARSPPSGRPSPLSPRSGPWYLLPRVALARVVLALRGLHDAVLRGRGRGVSARSLPSPLLPRPPPSPRPAPGRAGRRARAR